MFTLISPDLVNCQELAYESMQQWGLSYFTSLLTFNEGDLKGVTMIAVCISIICLIAFIVGIVIALFSGGSSLGGLIGLIIAVASLITSFGTFVYVAMRSDYDIDDINFWL